MADYAPALGKLIENGEEARKDAIHVAVAPMVAAELLAPGQRVRVLPNGRVKAAFDGPADGIVDPFLDHHVRPGERFWMALYPGTITGLRHVWSHPAFRPTPPEVRS